MMAEAEPPDKDFWFFLPLTVKYKDKTEFKPLTKNQYGTLCNHLMKELRRIQEKMPSIKQLTFTDSLEIEIVFIIKTNDEDLDRFYDFAKSTGDSLQNDIERALQQYLRRTKINLDLKLSSDTELKIFVSVDKKEYGKRQQDLKTVEKEKPIHNRQDDGTKEHNEGGKMAVAEPPDKDFCFLPLMVMYENAYLSKHHHSGLQRNLKDNISIVQKHFLKNRELHFVEIVDIHLESENLSVECAIPRNEENLCQLYQYSRKLEDERRNVIEDLMETCLEEIMGVEVSKRMQLYLFMPKVYFLTKQIELVKKDETFDVKTHAQREKQKSSSTVKDTEFLFEQGPNTMTSRLQQSFSSALESNRRHSIQEKVNCVSKTLVVAVTTKSEELVSSVKIISNSILGGIRLVPRGNEGNLYYTEVNIPDLDISRISYRYCAQIIKYRLGILPSPLKRESIELWLTDTPLQRDMFEDISHFDPKGIKEQVLDIFYSPGNDLDAMESCVKELDIFLKNIRFSFQEFKEFVNPLLKEIKKRNVKKGLTLLGVLLAITVPNLSLMHQVENLDRELTGMILEALRDYRLRELNMLNDVSLVKTCFTLCEIHFSTSFCVLTFMDTCYPFLDETYINQWFTEWLQTASDINLVTEGCEEHKESAKRLCSRFYQKCLNGNSDSVVMTLLSHIILHLPIGMAVYIANDLRDLSSQMECPFHCDLQEKISELVSDLVKGEIFDIVKRKNLDELYNLWDLVRESNFQPTETSDAFETAVINLLKGLSQTRVLWE